MQPKLRVMACAHMSVPDELSSRSAVHDCDAASYSYNGLGVREDSEEAYMWRLHARQTTWR